MRKIGIGKCKLLLSIYQVPTGGKALQWSSAKWSSAPTDRYIDAIHVFFPSRFVITHTNRTRRKIKIFFSLLLFSFVFFNSFELFLRYFQSGCNLPSVEPSSALIGRSSTCICNMGLGYVSISRGSAKSGSWFNISIKHIWA